MVFKYWGKHVAVSWYVDMWTDRKRPSTSRSAISQSQDTHSNIFIKYQQTTAWRPTPPVRVGDIASNCNGTRVSLRIKLEKIPSLIYTLKTRRGATDRVQ